jgi:hypothetical protein
MAAYGFRVTGTGPDVAAISSVNRTLVPDDHGLRSTGRCDALRRTTAAPATPSSTAAVMRSW